MTQQGKRSRRRQDAAVADKLNPLREKLAELDVDKAERERRQDAALTAYAEAEVERDRIAAQAESDVEQLQAQIQEVQRQASVERDATEMRQAEALVELNDLGRSAEDLSRLFGVPVKRVRSLIRSARPTPAKAAPPKQGSAVTPQATAAPTVAEAEQPASLAVSGGSGTDTAGSVEVASAEE